MTTHKSNDPSRRSFLGAGICGAAAAAGFSSLQAHAPEGDKSRLIPLTIAGYPYERVREIQEGRVKIPGCKIKFEKDRIGDLNRHVFSGSGTRDVTEVGLVPFLLAFCNDGFRDYEALPIFVLKVFRHKSIFVHVDRGIKKPQDLRGRKVATVGYSTSSLTWVRGILQEEYGIKPTDVQWVLTSKESSTEQTGNASKWEKQLPANLKVTKAPKGKDESALLLEGKVDAIFHAAEPKAYVDRHPKVARLFSDVRQVERAYFKKTGIFPIMHLVAIRRKLVKAKPWLRKAVFQAYSQAKQLDYEEMRKIRWAYSSLPWYGQELNETVELMGKNFYSYGIEQNQKTLEAAFRYLHQQGLAKRELKVKELFDQSTLDLKES